MYDHGYSAHTGSDAELGPRRALWSELAIVIHIGAFMDPADFRRRASEALAGVKASPKAPGLDEILIPGERAYRTRRERLISGIPLSNGTWQVAQRLCSE